MTTAPEWQAAARRLERLARQAHKEALARAVQRDSRLTEAENQAAIHALQEVLGLMTNHELAQALKYGP